MDSSSKTFSSFATLDVNDHSTLRESPVETSERRIGKPESSEGVSRTKNEGYNGTTSESSYTNVGASPAEHDDTSATAGSAAGSTEEEAGLRPKVTYTCRIHDVPLSRYCYDCNTIICAECALVVHRGHVCEDVALAANRCREIVSERLRHMRSIRTFTRASLEAVELRKTDIVGQTNMATGEINKQFDDMVSALQERREELLDRLAELSVVKLKSLCDQEQSLTSVVQSIERLTARVEKAMAVSGDEELINMHQQFEVLMNQEADRHVHIPRLPVEVPDIVVDIHCLEEVKGLCRTRSQVYRSNFSGEGIACAALGKEATFSLRSSTPVPQTAGIKVVLQSLVDSSVVVPMRVSSHEGSSVYQVTYTPKIRGRHQICAEENGAGIVGSPLDVFVNIELSQMGAVNRTIGPLQCPTALDFNGKDLALITQRDTEHLAVRTRHGKKVQDIKNARFRSCWGVTVDSDDNVYVSSAHGITKLSSDGRVIKMVGDKGTRPGEFDNPRGTHIINKKLYVCDRDNGRIQVFSTGLQLLEVISDAATKWASDVAGSPDGRLYVIGQGVPSIQVFTADHAYCNSIRHPDLSYPAAICFSPLQQRLFVVDCDSSGTCVFVFGLDGQFVTKWCVEGSSGVSYGIAADRDGFVYVCDGSKNLIHVL